MGDIRKAIADDEEYYESLCRKLGIRPRDDFYSHMSELEKAFGVSSKYDLFNAISKVQAAIADEAYKRGIQDFDIKELVKGNKVEFHSYRKGTFLYNLMVGTEVYTFPVPESDIGSGTLLRHDKAITFMRWIRKAIENKELVKTNE